MLKFIFVAKKNDKLHLIQKIVKYTIMYQTIRLIQRTIQSIVNCVFLIREINYHYRSTTFNSANSNMHDTK